MVAPTRLEKDFRTVPLNANIAPKGPLVQALPPTLFKRRRALVLLFLSLSFFCVYATEFALWFLDPVRGLPPHGNIDGRFLTWGHEWGSAYNYSWGKWLFRQRPMEIPKPPGTRRLMVVGDSYTFGVGLAEEERYTEILQGLLQRVRARHSWEVVNLGLMGAPTTFERDLVLGLGPLLDPDRIIVGFCFNDVDPTGPFPSAEHERFDRKHGTWIRIVEKTMGGISLPRLAARFRLSTERWGEITGRLPDYPTRLRRAYDPSSPPWKLFESALSDIAAFSKRRRLPPPLFAVLVSGRTSADFAEASGARRLETDAENRAAAAAEQRGYVVVRFEEDIHRLPPDTPLRVNRADGHPGAVLHRIFGKKLFETLTGTAG